jgi:hypothetical protein
MSFAAVVFFFALEADGASVRARVRGRARCPLRFRASGSSLIARASSGGSKARASFRDAFVVATSLAVNRVLQPFDHRLQCVDALDDRAQVRGDDRPAKRSGWQSTAPLGGVVTHLSLPR